jgi:hypothetical protein
VGTKRDGKWEQKRVVEEQLTLPADVRDQLRFIAQVDGTSVAQVINQMINNGVRHRKASDYLVRERLERVK